jgi:Ca2+-transporting ATPase
MDGTPWHALPPEEALRRLESRPEGLDEAEAERRRERYGANTIRAGRRVSPARIFLAQFTSPLIYILLIAAAISFATGHGLDGWVILAIVILNALIGFFQEYRAERALEALRALAAPKATVLRGGEPVEIEADQLVPGDVLMIAAGDRVPADARVLEAANLQSEEAALTGESTPTRKHTQALAPDASLGERENMLFLGTTVVTGRGHAVVTATGMETEMGAIAREVESGGVTQTPLQRKLAGLGGRLGIAAILLALLLVIVGLTRNLPLEELFFMGVAAAVSFIPEGLPAVVTVVLAVGVQRMVRRHAIIRKLPAVETLGSATFICTDKTGTLTKNEMTVRSVWLRGEEIRVEGEGYAPEGDFRLEGERVEPSDEPGLMLLLRAGALCNDARLREEEGRWSIAGDPTEGALLVAATKAGISRADLSAYYPRVDEIPFDPDERYMATLHAGPEGERWLFVKGAPERVLEMSTCILSNDEGEACPGTGLQAPGGESLRARALTPDMGTRVYEANHALAAEALRVLGFACRHLPSDVDKITPELMGEGLVFLGLAGMIDPPRPEARRSIETARRAGIQVMMITGDHRITARAIAAQLDLLHGDRDVVDGKEIEAMTDEELEARVERIAACARAEPGHKLRIVKALQALGHIVAMTGDGVNDAPALKRADIGVAMGITGTDVAKEASEMILTDDNFASIVGAVEEGRSIFANIRRVVVYLLGTNSGEILTLLAAVIAGYPLPLLPLQLLWINLVTDGAPTVALSQEPPHGRVLDEPPRPTNAPIIARALVFRIAFVALFMAAGTIGTFLWTWVHGDLAQARTVAFATMSVFQLFNIYNTRSLTDSVFRIGLWSNRWVTWGVLFSATLLIAAIHIGFLQTALRTVPLTLGQWGIVVLVSSTVLIAEEIRKWVAPGLFGLEISNSRETARAPVRVR